jgi:hypothetical protein
MAGLGALWGCSGTSGFCGLLQLLDAASLR